MFIYTVLDIIFSELYVVNFDQLVVACTEESCFVVFRHFSSFPSFFGVGMKLQIYANLLNVYFFSNRLTSSLYIVDYIFSNGIKNDVTSQHFNMSVG